MRELEELTTAMTENGTSFFERLFGVDERRPDGREVIGSETVGKDHVTTSGFDISFDDARPGLVHGGPLAFFSRHRLRFGGHQRRFRNVLHGGGGSRSRRQRRVGTDSGGNGGAGSGVSGVSDG